MQVISRKGLFQWNKNPQRLHAEIRNYANMIQSELYGDIERQTEMFCSPR